MPRRNVRAGHRGEQVSRGFGRVVVPGLLLIAAYYAVFGGQYSVFDVRSARASTESERVRLTELQIEIDSLRVWADSLRNDDSVIERIAREDFGMVRDGETLYRFAESAPDRTQETPTPVR